MIDCVHKVPPLGGSMGKLSDKSKRLFIALYFANKMWLGGPMVHDNVKSYLPGLADLTNTLYNNNPTCLVDT